MKRLTMWIGIAAPACGVSIENPLAAGESDDLIALKDDVAAIRQAQGRMEKDLQSLKDLLMGKQPPLENTLVNVAGRPTLGDASAAATLVEFSDFQCPFCGAYDRETFQRIVQQYVRAGKLRYVAFSFPLENTHAFARKAAEAALCAGDQGKYWDARTELFANQDRLAATDMADHARRIGADPALLTGCIDSGKHAQEVEKDLGEGRTLGVRGTPSFFLGSTDTKDRTVVHAVKLLVGNVPFSDFQTAIDELLKQANRGPLSQIDDRPARALKEP